jgi:hypothetical protein
VIEYLAPGFIYSVLKDIVSRYAPKRRELTNSEIVDLRKKWKAEIEPHILETHQKNLRQDVIIRDMRRIDSYPDIKEDEKGISPWFRVGLVGTYHRGLLVALQWASLTKHTDGKRYRRTNYKTEEKGDLNALLIGLIPFENIDNIDWGGDEYYGYPHVYCYFSHHREPYERVAYFTETVPLHGIPFYTEIESYQSVRKLSKKLGIIE